MLQGGSGMVSTLFPTPFHSMWSIILQSADGPDANPGAAGLLDGAVCSRVGENHVDRENMCWYHVCVYDSENEGKLN